MNIIEKYFGPTEAEKKKEVIENANTLYQVCEFNGELWITYVGSLVCPCSMLKDDAVEAIRKMRELYIERS